MTLSEWLLLGGLGVNTLWLLVALPGPGRRLAFALGVALVAVQVAWLVKTLVLEGPAWALGAWNIDLSLLLWNAIVAPVSIVLILIAMLVRGGWRLARPRPGH